MPNLSVAVCTFNRAEHLNRCLEALCQQVCDCGEFEIIVVDNASTDATADVVQRWIAKDKRFSYVYEPVQGLARARNAALGNAKAEFIAYTDDDAAVARDWVAKFLITFASLPVTVFAVGGEIDPVFECERPHWLTDELLRPLSAHLGWSESARFLQGDEWICEVNSAYRTSLLRKYGGFPEELGRQGDLLLSGENFVNEVACKEGWSIYFDPSIRVSHFIPASRLSKEWFRRRCFWQGVTAARLPRVAETRYGISHDHWRQLHLPASPIDWINMVSNDPSDAEFIKNCGRITELGYFLGSMNLISGR